MPARRMLLSLLATVAVVGAACGGAGGSAAPASSTGEPGGGASHEPGASVSPAELPQVLAFEGPLLGGGTLRGEDLAGKDVAFWFWAPW